MTAALSGPDATGMAREKVRLAVGSLPGNVVYLQIDLARALHYFQDEGLDVTSRFFDGGTEAAKALARSEFEFSANSIDHAIKLRGASGNPDLRMVASFTDLPCVTLVVRRDLRPRIRSIRDLKGARVGVTAIGAGTHVLLASVLQRAGFTLNDVTVVRAGAGDTMIAAIRNHEIEAGMATDPATTRLLLSGDASILLDMSDEEETATVFAGRYQFTGLMARAEVLRNRPALAQKMVNAVVRANRFIASHSAAQIAAALPADIVGDRYIFVKSLEHSRPGLSKDGRVSPVAVGNNIRSLRTFGLTLSGDSGSDPDPRLFLSNQFVDAAAAVPAR
jgi:NitT/TauT family transport system substrate-binding protein